MSRPPFFSVRTAWDTTETVWATLLAHKRSLGETLHDLTMANPTHAAFVYPPDLLEPLLLPEGKNYSADAHGLPAARQAVLRYYQDHHSHFSSREPLRLDLENIFLTTSTSEAYSYLFRLLCDPGDEIMIAQPSYPLFDFLADLEDVRLITYPVFYDYGWHLDLHALRSRITARTRAIILVHPNNPTGHYTNIQSRRALEQLCAKEKLALIVDEVFLDYALYSQPASFTMGEHPALTFVLSGLSKVAGLPQMKLSWISAFGPESLVNDARKRLEVIADTFLSVNAPIQHATPVWLQNRRDIQQQITSRVRENLTHLDMALQDSNSIERLVVEGGWYAILRVPALASGEELAYQLLSKANVIVHPGIFFGMPMAAWLVISLITPPLAFSTAIQALIRYFQPAE